MYKIFKTYLFLVRKHNLNTLWVVLLYIIFPLLLSIISLYFYDITIKILDKGASDIINFLVLLSGFLFTSIWIILANSQISSLKIKELSIKLKKRESDVIDFLNNLKKLLTYEIIIQFFFIVIATFFLIIVKTFTNEFILFFWIYFISLSIIWIYRLSINFILYQKNTSFINKIKD